MIASQDVAINWKDIGWRNELKVFQSVYDWRIQHVTRVQNCNKIRLGFRSDKIAMSSEFLSVKWKFPATP